MGRDGRFTLLRTFIRIASGGDDFCDGMTVGLRISRTTSGTVERAFAEGGGGVAVSGRKGTAAARKLKHSLCYGGPATIGHYTDFAQKEVAPRAAEIDKTNNFPSVRPPFRLTIRMLMVP